jgi:thymidylate synthase
MYLMQPYDDALEQILRKGVWKSSKRTGVRTLALCGLSSRYDLSGDAFPIVTRRKVWPKAIFAELLWFLSGSTNNNDLEKLGARIWRPWVDEKFEAEHGFAPGAFGPIYGFQLRHFGGVYGNGIGGPKRTDRTHTNESDGGLFDRNGYDSLYGYNGFDQMADLMARLKKDPTDRRLLFSLWNPAQVKEQKLPPCHLYYQVFVDDEGRLSGFMNQRSCDFPIGVPANIQFYAALTVMVAHQAGFTPHEFVHSTVDSHIYENQIGAVEDYLALPKIDSPTLIIKKGVPNIFSYELNDFVLENYNPGPKLEIPVAI